MRKPRRFKEIGQRLKAYRLGSGLGAEEVAARLGVSRAALYRIESGEVVKIETLERLAEVLSTSMASLLGVGVEYYAKAISYFERMRQLEAEAEQVVAHFAPVSYLLTSEAYAGHLRAMLIEALPASLADTRQSLAEIDAILAILKERKAEARRRRPSIVNLVSAPEIERFLQLGLIGRFDLSAKETARRRAAAFAEVEAIATLMMNEPMGVQIGLIEDTLPNITFQLFRNPTQTFLAVSPFRLGEQPNIRYGIATVTAAEEPVALYTRLAEDLWRGALKGPRGAALLQEMLKRAR